MPVTVKTFASFGEAASALSSDRGARYLGGGTLVMRALNEGDISISTVVRATDQALSRIDVASARVTIGAGVTFARILAERDARTRDVDAGQRLVGRAHDGRDRDIALVERAHDKRAAAEIARAAIRR